MPSRCRGGLLAAGLVWILARLTQPEWVFAAEGAGRWGIWETVGRFFNLALVVGVLIYVLRKPLGDFFEERRQGIRKRLHEAEEARKLAEARLAEVRQQLSGLEAEKVAIKEKAEQEAVQERHRTRELAHQEAERIVAIARREADALVRAAGVELRRQAAQLAVEMAEQKIRGQMGTEEDQRLVERFTRGIAERVR